MSEVHSGNDRFSKILIPMADFVSKEKIIHGLQVLSVFKNPLVVLLHVIEVPSRTQTLNSYPYEKEVADHRSRLESVANWLRGQDYDVEVKVAIARNIVEGIVSEANLGNYDAVLMLKRRMRKGFSRIFHRSTSETVIRSVESVVLTTLVDYQ